MGNHRLLKPGERRGQVSIQPSRWEQLRVGLVCSSKLQIIGIDNGVAHQNAGALNDVLDFAHVARPVMRLQRAAPASAEPLVHPVARRQTRKCSASGRCPPAVPAAAAAGSARR